MFLGKDESGQEGESEAKRQVVCGTQSLTFKKAYLKGARTQISFVP